MLKLEITEMQISSIFSDKKIAKAFNSSIHHHDELIDTFIFDFYNRIHSDTLLSELNISKEDIRLVCLSSIKHDIINFAIKSSFDERKYNIKKNIISLLKNEQVLGDFCTNTRHFEKCFYDFAINNVTSYQKSIIKKELRNILIF